MWDFNFLQLHQRHGAGNDLLAAQVGDDAASGNTLGGIRAGGFDVVLLHAVQYRFSNRVLRAVFSGGTVGEDVPLTDTLHWDNGGGFQLAVGDGAGFVKDNGIDAGCSLHNVAAAVEDTQICTAAGAGDDSDRGRKAQRTGAGDNQNGDKVIENKGDVPPADCPQQRGDDGDGDNRRDKDAGNLVGKARGRGFALLRFGHQAQYLGDSGVAADAGRLDFEHAVLADGAARNVGTGLLVDRQALAGQHRLIHRGLAGQDGSIDWDAGAGLDDDGVFDPDIFGGDLHLLALLVEDDGGVGDH